MSGPKGCPGEPWPAPRSCWGLALPCSCALHGIPFGAGLQGKDVRDKLEPGYPTPHYLKTSTVGWWPHGTRSAAPLEILARCTCWGKLLTSRMSSAVPGHPAPGVEPPYECTVACGFSIHVRVAIRPLCPPGEFQHTYTGVSPELLGPQGLHTAVPIILHPSLSTTLKEPTGTDGFGR